MKVAFVSVRVSIADSKKRQLCEQLKLPNLNRDAASLTGVLQSTMTPETVVPTTYRQGSLLPAPAPAETILSPGASPKSGPSPR
jgi:hypothetical protein